MMTLRRSAPLTQGFVGVELVLVWVFHLTQLVCSHRFVLFCFNIVVRVQRKLTKKRSIRRVAEL